MKTEVKTNHLNQAGSFAALVITVIVITLFGALRMGKQRHYRRLAAAQRQFRPQIERSLRFPDRNLMPTPSFAERIATIPNFLPAETFEHLKDVVLAIGTSERSYLPVHKQGGTVAYETLHEVAPEVVTFFNSNFLSNLISDIVGEAVQPTPIHDQSSCSLLFYTKPGDHINWHYDHNFYNGRHFTVLLPIINQQNSDTARPSSARLIVRKGVGEATYEEPVSSAPNTLILFEGAQVMHKVTRIGPDETRIMLSMTFCTSPHASALKSMIRRGKDIAFFGIRALWS